MLGISLQLWLAVAAGQELPDTWWVVLEGDHDYPSLEPDGSLFFGVGLYGLDADGYSMRYPTPAPEQRAWLDVEEGRLLGWDYSKDQPVVFQMSSGAPYPNLPAFVHEYGHWGFAGPGLWVIDGSATLKLIDWDAGWTCESITTVEEPLRRNGPRYDVHRAGDWLFLVEPPSYELHVFRKDPTDGWVEVEHEIDGAMEVRSDGEWLVIAGNYLEDGQGGYGLDLPPTVYRLPDLTNGVVLTEREVLALTMELADGRLTVREMGSYAYTGPWAVLYVDLNDPERSLREVPPFGDGPWSLEPRMGRLVARSGDNVVWFDPADAELPPWTTPRAPDQALTVDSLPPVDVPRREERWRHVVDCPERYEPFGPELPWKEAEVRHEGCRCGVAEAGGLLNWLHRRR